MQARWLASLAVGVLTVAFGATPYVAAHRLMAAAEARDAAALSGRVDFPALRANLKAELTRQLQGGEAATGLRAALGGALASALVQPAVEAAVTPENLARLFAGQSPAVASPDNRPKHDTGPANAERAATETRLAYETWDRFAITLRQAGRPAQPVTLLLERRGLWDWKLAGVRLPL